MHERRSFGLRVFAAKLRGLVRGESDSDEFDAEIREHLRLLADRFAAQGMSREEVAVAARRQFGNRTLLQRTAERCRRSHRSNARVLMVRTGRRSRDDDERGAAGSLGLGFGSWSDPPGTLEDLIGEQWYAATTLLLTMTAAIACSIPARRAARVDPMVALRYD